MHAGGVRRPHPLLRASSSMRKAKTLPRSQPTHIEVIEPTAVPTDTPIPSPTGSPTPSRTPTRTFTPTPTFTITPSNTPTPTYTKTSTATPTKTFSERIGDSLVEGLIDEVPKVFLWIIGLLLLVMMGILILLISKNSAN